MKTKKPFLTLAILITSISFGQTNMFPATGNVGIGTTNPSAILHINKSGLAGELDYNLIIQKTNISDSDKSAVGLLLSTECCGNFGKSAIVHERTGGYGIGNLYFLNNNAIDSSNPTLLDAKMAINSSGNVGIGTTDPKSKLHVFGQENGDFNGLVIDNRKNYGSGSGINQTSRILLSLSENSVPNPLDRIFSIIESGTLSESDSSNGRLSFYVRQWGSVNEKMRINYDGNVGIGTTSPSAKLEVAGDAKINGILNVSGTNALNFSNYGGGLFMQDDSWIRTFGDKNFYHNTGIMRTDGIFQVGPSGDRLVVSTNGNVGIGSLYPDQKLTVKGKIHTEEIIVDLSVPADYVFQKYYTGKSELKLDYVMPTLIEIENFTKKNHHLPNVPSAQEIKQNGLSLGEMSNVLLQKVEELTLYAIEQQRKLEEQNKTIETQSKILEVLTTRLNTLEKK